MWYFTETHGPFFARELRTPLPDEVLAVNGYGRGDRSANDDDDDIYLASLAGRGSPAPIASASSDGPPEQAGNRRPSRLVITVLLLLILGPVAWRWWPKEVARWYSAIAAEKQLDGDAQAAQQALAAALWWDPESAATFRQRGDLLTDQGHYDQALEDYHRAIELDPDDPVNLIKRSVALQFLGKHAEAIQDWQQLESMWRDRGQEGFAMALNGLAYARALGNSELDQALAEVNQALQFGGRNSESRAAMLDTRGYIQLLRGEYQAARQDLDRAIQSMEMTLASASGVKNYPDPREYEQYLKQLNHSVAVMYYHRALMFEQLGELELAARDLQRVHQLGHEPGDHLF
jgi:tetratricopeptide (TPR) repeat protein